VAASCFLRRLTAPAYVESADGYNFVAGLGRYSVPMQQPHWPGYPVYMWTGRLVALFAPGPVEGLHALSVIASSLTAIPLAGLASALARGAGLRAGLAAAILWLVVPVSWLTGTEIYSDSLAVFLGVAALWSLVRFLDDGDDAALLVASVLDGLMLGVRLAYLPLVLPLVYVGRARPAVVAAGLLGTMAVWLSWQILFTGLGSFVIATLFHLTGHFVEWGNAITTETHLADRVPHFLDLFVRDALGAASGHASIPRLCVGLGWATVMVVGLWRARRGSPSARWVVLFLWTVPYLVWVLLIHDLSVIRYALPTAAAVCVLAGCALPERPAARYPLLAGLAVSLAIVSAPLAAARQSPHVSQRISSFVLAAARPRGAVLLTDAFGLGRPLWAQLGGASNVLVKPIKDTATAAAPAPGRPVYLLSKAPVARADAVLVARFCHDVEVDRSLPGQVWLYRIGMAPDEEARAVTSLDSGCASCE
jgi:Protein O-mannosyl-transferase TMEM260-like